jgi:hypothetical protein
VLHEEADLGALNAELVWLGEGADAARARLIEVAPRYVSEGPRRARVSNRRLSPADVRVPLPVAPRVRKALCQQ